MNEAVSPELKERALRPRLEFGHNILAEQSRGWGEYLLITMPEVWKNAEPMLAQAPAHVHFVTTMDRAEVERAEQELPELPTIVGIGGGMVMDMAKYAAWKRGREPVLAPSIASVDACVTNAIAVRDRNRVHYLGFVAPQIVIGDFTLMKTAPPHLNRAGVGDILSIHTGRFDWKLAADKGQVEFNAELDREAAQLVDELEARAEEIRDVTDRGLQWLIEAYARENRLCLQVGHSRPEEGSEHFFAYNVEHQTRRSFVHGELVCLGVLLMARLQKNQPERVLKILQTTGVRYQPRELELLPLELKLSVCSLPSYVDAENLFYSVVNEAMISPDVTEHLAGDLIF